MFRKCIFFIVAWTALLPVAFTARADILEYIPAIVAGCQQSSGIAFAEYYILNPTTYDYTLEARSYSRDATFHGTSGLTEQLNLMYGSHVRSRFFKWVDGSLYLYGTSDGDTENVFDTPADLGRTMAPGSSRTLNISYTTYDGDGVQIGTGTSTLTLTLSGPVSVTVDAGTYETYRLDMSDQWTSTVPGWGSGTNDESMWLARDVGIVKMTSHEDGGPTYTFELQSDTMDITIADYFKLNTTTHNFTETTQSWPLTTRHQNVTVADAGTIKELYITLNGSFLNGRFMNYTSDGMLYSLGSRGDTWMELYFSPLYMGRECRLNVTYAYSKGEYGYNGTTGAGGKVGSGNESGTFRVTGPETVAGLPCYRATTTSTWSNDAWGSSGSETVIYWLNATEGIVQFRVTDAEGTFTFLRNDL